MSKWLREVIVFGLYVALATVITLPSLLKIQHTVIGTGGDPWQSIWRFETKANEWQQAVSSGSVGNYLKNEFFGGGSARLVNLSVWPWMWLHSVAEEPVTYNVIWWLSFVLSGYFMYLLVRYLLANEGVTFKQDYSGKSWWQLQVGPILAGLAYMFLPYHVAHSYGHFGAMQTQWLPLLFLILFAWIRKPSIWLSLVFGLLFSIQGWTEHHYAVWFALATVIVLLWRMRDIRSQKLTKLTLSALTFLVVVIIAFIAPYLPTARLALTGENPLNLGAEQTTRFSADLFSFITPASFHALWGSVSNKLFAQHFSGNVSEATQYLGLSVLLFVIFFNQTIPQKQKYTWLTVATVFWIIALGPTLQIMGLDTKLPLPYRLIMDLPIIDSVRTVARSGIMVGLSLSVLFGLAAATQISRFRVAIALATILLIDFAFLPVQAQSTKLSAAYDIAHAALGTRIIELPAATNYTIASRALYASNTHGKEVIGNIALERAEGASALNEERSLPALRQLLFMRTGHMVKQREDFFGQNVDETLPDVLKYLDVGAILIHKDSVTEQQWQTIKQYIESGLGLTSQTFDDIVIYQLPEKFSKTTDGIFIARDGQWQNVGYDPKRDSVFAEVPTVANLTIYNISNQPKKVTLKFTIPSESHGSFSVIENGASIYDSQAKAGDTVLVPVTVPSGSITVTFNNNSTSKLIVQNPTIDEVK